MIENNVPILLVALPLAGAFLVALVKFTRLPRVVFGWASVAVLVAAAALAVVAVKGLAAGAVSDHVVGNWARDVGIVIRLNGLSWFATVIIVGTGLLAVLYSLGRGYESPTYYTLVLLLLGGMLGVVVSADLFNIVVFFEIMAVSSYILVAYTKEDRAVKASFVYLVLSSLGFAFILVGVAILYQQTGTLSLDQIAVRARSLKGADSERIGFAVSLCVAGFGVKAAFLPLHAWLPDAHANAPTPVSALLSGVLIKVGFLTVYRITEAFGCTGIQEAFLWIGPATAVLGVVLALAQTDIKKILAYHSVSQMGYILTAYGAAAAPGLRAEERMAALAAAFLHVLNHSTFKSLLFLSADGAIEAGGTRDTRRLGGLMRAAPVSAIACFVGALAIAGMPPFNGFISKSLVVRAASAHAVPAALIAIAGVGTVASFIKLTKAFWGRRRSETADDSGRAAAPREPFLGSLSLATLSAVCLALGLFPSCADWMLSLVFAGRFEIKPIYHVGSLVSSAVYLVLGVVLFAAADSAFGRRVCAKVKSCDVGLSASLALLVGMVILFTVIESFGR